MSTTAQKAGPQAGGRILIVEDEPHIVELVRYNLVQEGFQVSVAYDGAEALQKAKLDCPDLVILDLMLPYVDGLEVCRHIRRESAVPILMLTAKDGEQHRVVGLEMGADDYLSSSPACAPSCGAPAGRHPAQAAPRSASAAWSWIQRPMKSR